jgi:prepilin-type N-terminal cleavage/methylation domain-containing protein
VDEGIHVLTDERGMSLVEMMIAMVIAMVISLASFALIDFSMRRAGEVAGRVDADQRGRVAMDTITRQLRSQVCQQTGTPPMVGGTATNPTDANDASFFVDLSNGSSPAVNPQLHTLSYQGAPNYRIVESDWTPTVPGSAKVDPKYTGSPTTRVLLSDVLPIGTTPVFSYYDAAGNQLTGTLSGTTLGQVARIDIAFRAAPSGTTKVTPVNPDPRGSIDMQDRVTVRIVDPNADTPHPQCA